MLSFDKDLKIILMRRYNIPLSFNSLPYNPNFPQLGYRKHFENNMGKGENAGCLHFLPFQQDSLLL